MKKVNKFGLNNQSNRDEWLEKTLSSLDAGQSILDAGAGELKYKSLCSHLKYVSQDFCKYNGTGNEEGLQTGDWNTKEIDIVSDITSIPVDDESFDAILCVEVLEHLPDPVLALNEFSRILRKGGKVIITAPFCSLTHFAPYHFYSGFNKYFFSHHLDRLGFENVEIVPNGNYFEYLAQELLLRVPNDYSTFKISFIGKIIIRIVVSMLHKLAKCDRGSDELLCFGYHVHAIKK